MVNLHESSSQRLDHEPGSGDIQHLSATEVKEFLIRPDITGYIANSLRRTNTEGTRLMGKLLGREFGFVAYSNLTPLDRSIHASPLWEGEAENIHLHDLSIGYLAENPGLPQTVVFDFHTHTHLFLPVLREIGDKRALETDDRENDMFSFSDLKSFYFELYENPNNPFRIRALGTERDGKGKLVLVTFNSVTAAQSFNYEEVYERSIEYLKAGKDPLEAYREAGLNVATIDIDLSRQPVLDENDVEIASKILTRAES